MLLMTPLISLVKVRMNQATVSKIIDSRIDTDGSILFQVEWKRTWERADSLHQYPELVDSFMKYVERNKKITEAFQKETRKKARLLEKMAAAIKAVQQEQELEDEGTEVDDDLTATDDDYGETFEDVAASLYEHAAERNDAAEISRSMKSSEHAYCVKESMSEIQKEMNAAVLNIVHTPNEEHKFSSVSDTSTLPEQELTETLESSAVTEMPSTDMQTMSQVTVKYRPQIKNNSPFLEIDTNAVIPIEVIKRTYKRVDTGERRCRHKCNICGIVIKDTYLRVHHATHVDHKPFKCILCSSQFKRKKDFMRHVKKLHPEGRP